MQEEGDASVEAWSKVGAILTVSIATPLALLRLFELPRHPDLVTAIRKHWCAVVAAYDAGGVGGKVMGPLDTLHEGVIGLYKGKAVPLPDKRKGRTTLAFNDVMKDLVTQRWSQNAAFSMTQGPDGEVWISTLKATRLKAAHHGSNFQDESELSPAIPNILLHGHDFLRHIEQEPQRTEMARIMVRHYLFGACGEAVDGTRARKQDTGAAADGKKRPREEAEATAISGKEPRTEG
jgi:hypothetical protein